ncbi:type III secretion protein F [Gammaproteobacteria bacterium]
MDMNAIDQYFGAAATKAEGNLETITKEADPNNTKDMLAMQKAMTEWSMVISMTSTAMKAVKDTVSGIIQKMG